MFRKTIIAITTVAAVGAAALVPASAGGGGNWGGNKGNHQGHFGFRTGVIVAAPLVASCGLQWQYVQTRRGLVRMLIDTCTGLPL